MFFISVTLRADISLFVFPVISRLSISHVARYIPSFHPQNPSEILHNYISASFRKLLAWYFYEGKFRKDSCFTQQ